jgi:hypothetical protein
MRDDHHLDRLAALFLRWRLRSLGLTFEQFVAASPKRRQHYVAAQRRRLRDWRHNPRTMAGLIILLN